MATLFNTKIKDTYQSLLKLEDNTILTTTVKNVTDGLGNASPLYMSTTRIGIGTNAPISTMHIAGLSTFVGASGSTLGSTTANAAAQFYQTGFNGVLAIGGYSNGGGELQSYQSGGASLGGTIFLQRQTGNVLIGSASDTAKLSIKGSGSTSATTSLLVQNSSGTTALEIFDSLTVRSDNSQLFFPNTSAQHRLGLMTFTNNSISCLSNLNIGGNTATTFTNTTLAFQTSTTFNAMGSPNNATRSGISIVGDFTNAGAGIISIGNNFNITTALNTSVGTVTLNQFNITNAINTTGGITLQRGFYYNPTLTSTVGFTHNAIETVTGNVLLGTNSGNVMIGTSTDEGFKLNVNGAIRSTGNLRVVSYSGAGTAFIIVDDNGTVLRNTGWSYDRVTLNTWVNGSQQTSSVFTLNSTTAGFLPPRMTNAQRGLIASPAIGLMVYCTDAVEGLYIYKSTGWTFVA